MAGRRPAIPPADPAAVQRAAETFLESLGVIRDRRLLRASARRIAEAWSGDLLRGYQVDPAALLETIPAGRERGVVVVRGITFTSVCVHHLLPFQGVASLAYLPGRHLTGLSKLARVVEALAARLQIQEELTGELVRLLQDRLRPRGAGAVVEAEHLCMTARGIRSRGSRVVTAAWSGCFDRDPAQRRWLLALLGAPAAS